MTWRWVRGGAEVALWWRHSTGAADGRRRHSRSCTACSAPTPPPHPQVKKLCLAERQARTHAAAAAARGGAAKLPPELVSSNGRTPEMRMGATIMEAYEFKLQGTHVGAVRVCGCVLVGGGGRAMHWEGLAPRAGVSCTSVPPGNLPLLAHAPLRASPPPQTSLKEVLENIEQTRTVWHMQLDHQRNRVLCINLLIRWGLCCAD